MSIAKKYLFHILSLCSLILAIFSIVPAFVCLGFAVVAKLGEIVDRKMDLIMETKSGIDPNAEIKASIEKLKLEIHLSDLESEKIRRNSTLNKDSGFGPAKKAMF